MSTIRELVEDLHQHFQQKTKPTSEEKNLLKRLMEAQAYFPISSLTRDDLESKGFDISNVADSEMSTLADKLGNDYHEQLYWPSMENIAENSIGIPRYICPKCGNNESAYNSYEKTFQCVACEHTWKKEEPTGLYVLVEANENDDEDEDTSFYEKNGIGYPCYNSEDNGAIYVPEHIYRQHTGKDPIVNTLFQLVRWPDSQKYMTLEPESIAELCEPIDDVKLVEIFGEMSIWVPLCLIEE